MARVVAASSGRTSWRPFPVSIVHSGEGPVSSRCLVRKPSSRVRRASRTSSLGFNGESMRPSKRAARRLAPHQPRARRFVPRRRLLPRPFRRHPCAVHGERRRAGAAMAARARARLGHGGIRHAAARDRPSARGARRRRGKQSGRTQEIQRLIGRSLARRHRPHRARRAADHARLRRAAGRRRHAHRVRSPARGSRSHDAVAWMQAAQHAEDERRLARSRRRRVLRALSAARRCSTSTMPRIQRREADANFVMTGLGRHRRGAGHRRAASRSARRSSIS